MAYLCTICRLCLRRVPQKADRHVVSAEVALFDRFGRVERFIDLCQICGMTGQANPFGCSIAFFILSSSSLASQKNFDLRKLCADYIPVGRECRR